MGLVIPKKGRNIGTLVEVFEDANGGGDTKSEDVGYGGEHKGSTAALVLLVFTLLPAELQDERLSSQESTEGRRGEQGTTRMRLGDASPNISASSSSVPKSNISIGTGCEEEEGRGWRGGGNDEDTSPQ